MTEPTETSAAAAAGRDHVTDERVTQLFNLADEILRTPSRFTKDFVVNELGQAVAELAGAVERTRKLPRITDGITDLEAEASATFDLTIDEVRSLKADRDAAISRAEKAEAERDQARFDLETLRAQVRVEWGYQAEGRRTAVAVNNEGDARQAARQYSRLRLPGAERPTVTYHVVNRLVGEWRPVDDSTRDGNGG